MGTGTDHGYVIPPRYWRWAGSGTAVRVYLWLAAVAVGVHHLDHARRWLADHPGVPDHLRRPAAYGYGHTQIDFGGQWVMGRLLALGHGRELYHRQAQWAVVRDAYPRSDESVAQREEAILPKDRRRLAGPDDKLYHDADRMMDWFMGADPPGWKTAGGAAAAPLAAGHPLAAVALSRAAADAVTPEVVREVEAPAVGGPLYPPAHAFVYAPLGLFDRPHDAYAVFQVIAVGFAFVAGLGVSALSGGRVWWSAASVGLLLYPGCRSGLDLGQNPTLSVSIVVWGWALAARGRDGAGGAVWGLFAFKPVWGLAFFLVPVLTGRWRMAASMVGTGAAFGALTLPVVGVQTWFDWLAVGKEAAELYNRNTNWINLSRDLQGFPRRWLIDFSLPEADRATAETGAWAWGVWAAVFAATVGVYLLRADRRRAVGRGAGFLFLGAFLCCYRFMYYDVLLSAVGVAALLADPRTALRTWTFALRPQRHPPPIDPAPPDPAGPRLVGYLNSVPLTLLFVLYLLDNYLVWETFEATVGVGGWSRVTTAADGSTGLSTPRLRVDSSLVYPWDTAVVLLLWAWVGLGLILRRERPLSEETVKPVAGR